MHINSQQVPSRTAYLLNKVGLFDEYIAYRESDNTDAILVGEIDKNGVFNGNKYTVTYIRNGYNNEYTTMQQTLVDETITYDNEYYLYSNIGIGQQAQIYGHQQILTGATVMLLGIVIGYMLLKGAGGVWQWLRAGR